MAVGLRFLLPTGECVERTTSWQTPHQRAEEPLLGDRLLHLTGPPEERDPHRVDHQQEIIQLGDQGNPSLLDGNVHPRVP